MTVKPANAMDAMLHSEIRAHVSGQKGKIHWLRNDERLAAARLRYQQLMT